MASSSTGIVFIVLGLLSCICLSEIKIKGEKKNPTGLADRLKGLRGGVVEKPREPVEPKEPKEPKEPIPKESKESLDKSVNASDPANVHGINYTLPLELKSHHLKTLHGRFDENDDGRASLDEVIKYHRKMDDRLAKESADVILKEADLNKDGYLSLDELITDFDTKEGLVPVSNETAAKHEELKAEKHAALVNEVKLLDRNGDNLLDADELKAVYFPDTHEGLASLDAGDLLKEQDFNKDQKVSMTEFVRANTFGRLDEKNDEHGELAALQAAFKKLDADGDSFLNQKELAPWATGRFQAEDFLKHVFSLTDKDNDGHVTAEELEHAHHSKLMPERARQTLQSWYSLTEEL